MAPASLQGVGWGAQTPGFYLEEGWEVGAGSSDTWVLSLVLGVQGLGF